jgi:hypothetical protein
LGLVAALCAACSSLPVGKDWPEKSIIEKGELIYAVGHSGLRGTEQAAKDAALVQATAEFVKYCGVEVTAFDRSIETYSRSNAQVLDKEDLTSLAQTRAKAFVARALPVAWKLEPMVEGWKAAVLLRVPRKEYERIREEKDVQVSVDVGFYSEGKDGKMQVLKEGEVLRSGDAFVLFVRPSEECYLYAVQVDALGKAFRLFPNDGFQTRSNPLAPGVDHWLPNETKAFELDETTGRETVYLFASRRSISQLEGSFNALTGKDIEGLIQLKKMGVARVRDKVDPRALQAPKTLATDVLDLKRKLQAEGDFVHTFWFWHR